MKKIYVYSIFQVPIDLWWSCLLSEGGTWQSFPPKKDHQKFVSAVILVVKNRHVHNVQYKYLFLQPKNESNSKENETKEGEDTW